MASNVVFNSIRMNMNNSQHVKVNAVLSNLDSNVCKSKNQMIIDAIEFYIDHFGKDTFIPKAKEKVLEYVTVGDLEKIEEELTERVITEARREVIRLLATAVVDKGTIDKERYVTLVDEKEKTEDDSVMSDLASSWMEQSFGGIDE